MSRSSKSGCEGAGFSIFLTFVSSCLTDFCKRLSPPSGNEGSLGAGDETSEVEVFSLSVPLVAKNDDDGALKVLVGCFGFALGVNVVLVVKPELPDVRRAEVSPKPVATTLTRISPSIELSKAVPKMMFASASTSSRIRFAASSTS